MRAFKGHKDLVMNTIAWTGIFLAEALLAFLETSSEQPPGFTDLFLHRFFLPTLPFVALFAAHDLLAAPILIRRKRTLAYSLCVAVMMGVFSVYILDSDGIFREGPPPPRSRRFVVRKGASHQGVRISMTAEKARRNSGRREGRRRTGNRSVAVSARLS